MFTIATPPTTLTLMPPPNSRQQYGATTRGSQLASPAAHIFEDPNFAHQSCQSLIALLLEILRCPSFAVLR